jgi:hypothetical protein
MISLEWDIKRLEKHIGWLNRRRKPNPAEIKEAMDRLLDLKAGKAQPVDAGKSRLLQLISKVVSEKENIDRQMTPLLQKGGCSGCKQKSLKLLQEKHRFYQDIESELRKNL